MGIVRKTKSVNAILDVFDQTDNAYSGVHLIDQMKNQMNKLSIHQIRNE